MQDCISGYVKFKPVLTEMASKARWAPDHVTAALAHSRTERCMDFMIDLIQKASDKGYGVLSARGPPEEEEDDDDVMDEVKDCGIEVKEREDMRRQMMYDELKDCYEDEFKLSDMQVKAQDANARDRMVCEMNGILQHYPEKELSFEEFTVAAK